MKANEIDSTNKRGTRTQTRLEMKHISNGTVIETKPGLSLNPGFLGSI